MGNARVRQDKDLPVQPTLPITAADEDAIRQVPEDAWKPGIGQDGAAEADKDAAVRKPSGPGTGRTACAGSPAG